MNFLNILLLLVSPATYFATVAAPEAARAVKQGGIGA